MEKHQHWVLHFWQPGEGASGIEGVFHTEEEAQKAAFNFLHLFGRFADWDEYPNYWVRIHDGALLEINEVCSG